MEELIGLVHIVSKNKVKKIEVIGSPSNYNSNLQKLYDGISSKRIVTNKDAESFLFPQDPQGSIKFKRLKNRLSKRLIDTLFFIDTSRPKFTSPQKAYYNCYKDFAAMKLLQGRGERLNFLKIGERTLKLAMAHEFTDLSVNILRDLQVHYGSFSTNRKRLREIQELLMSQFEELRLEVLAEGYYVDLINSFVGSNASKKEMKDIALDYAEKLRPHLSPMRTQRFSFIAYLVIILSREINNDYEEVIRSVEAGVEMLNTKGTRINNTYLTIFLSKKINGLIKLGELEASEEAIKATIELTEEKQLNWYVLKDLQLKMLFHSRKYQRAFRVFVEVNNPAILKSLPGGYEDQWKLYEAYIHYFIASGKINLTIGEQRQLRKFRLSKFINDIPAYSKDKRGGNIQALVLQMMFLILEKKYEKSGEQLNALKSYSHRYLKKDSTYRSNCFIHMLMQLPKSYYNRKAAIRKTEKYVKRLSEVPLETADQTAELEIVPYEDLWEMVLMSLKG